MVDDNDRVLCSRKILEEIERQHKMFCVKQGYGLAEQFSLSSDSRGRLNEEDDDGDWRTTYQRDYDRVIWSDGYARLRNKSQTALQPINQEITTRLTHVIKVAQLAVRNCQFMFLNPDLGAAIGAAHDLGHSPFGHAGEEAITIIVRKILGDDSYYFHHAKYGLDIVERVEKDGQGLNLSWEVKDGILHHSRGKGDIDGFVDAMTPEGVVAKWSDKFAYISSDIRDFLKLGILKEGDLPAAEMKVLGCEGRYSKSRILDELNYGLVTSSLQEGKVCFTGERREAFNVIHKWMYDNVYGKGDMKPEFEKAQEMIYRVFTHVMETEFGNLSDEEAVNKTIDVVACMTDESIDRYDTEISKPKRLY